MTCRILPYGVPAAAMLLTLVTLTQPTRAQTIYPTGTTIWDHERTFPGYNLFNGPDGIVRLVNMAGVEVHRWTSPVAGRILSLAEPLANGHVLATVKNSNQAGGNIAVELDNENRVVWTYVLTGTNSDYIHHEVERLANGNTLLLCAQGINVPSISPQLIVDDYIIEVDPQGNVVWSWYTWQHFAEFGFDPQAKQLIANAAGTWAHTNAVSPLPPSRHTLPALQPGNLLVSQRDTNIMFIIDRATGSVVWKMGPANPLTQGQHAPHMIPQGLPGAGNILVFDNGSGTGYPAPGQARAFSRVLEIDPATQQTMWDYDAGKSGLFSRLFFSDVVSNAQRLTNGNTMVCSGVTGRLFEITPSGDLVWEYMSPYFALLPGNQKGPLIYRAFRIPWPSVPGAPVSNQ